MTIKEIAEKAGVSIATVSYTLNNTGRISEEVRQRVLKIVEENGYRKNRLAQNLRANSNNAIGVVIEDITVLFSAQMVHGVSEFAEKHNKDILLTNLALNSKIGKNFDNFGAYQEKVRSEVELLLAAQVEGIIYIGMHDRDITGLIGKVEKPLCVVGCYTNDFSYITYDNIDVAREIGRYFVRKGHKEIAVIGGTYDSKVSYKRFSGFQQGLREGGVHLNSANIRTGDWEFADGYHLAGDLLEKEVPPTAIFAMNDLMAAGVLTRALKMGIHVPEQLEVFGFDDEQLTTCTYPTLSTVKVPRYEMGYRAAQQLYEPFGEIKRRREKVMLPCELIFRGSTRKHENEDKK